MISQTPDSSQKPATDVAFALAMESVNRSNVHVQYSLVLDGNVTSVAAEHPVIRGSGMRLVVMATKIALHACVMVADVADVLLRSVAA